MGRGEFILDDNDGQSILLQSSLLKREMPAFDLRPVKVLESERF